MSKIIIIYLSSLFLLIPSVISSELRVAVIDLEAAIEASKAAQAVEKQMDIEFEKEKRDLINLRMEIDDLEAMQTKESQTISEGKAEELKLKMKEKQTEYQLLFDLVSKQTEKRYGELVSGIDPLIQQAIKEVLESGEYDLIHSSNDILHFDPKLDISQKLTEKLNQLTANTKIGK